MVCTEKSSCTLPLPGGAPFSVAPRRKLGPSRPLVFSQASERWPQIHAYSWLRLALHPIEPVDLWGDHPITNHKSITVVLTRNGCKVHPCLPLPSGPGGEGSVWSSGDPGKGSQNCQGSQIPSLPVPTGKPGPLCSPQAPSPWRLTRSERRPGLAGMQVFAGALDTVSLQRWHRRKPLQVGEDR